MYYPKKRYSSYPIYFYQDGSVKVDGKDMPVMREKYHDADWIEK
jgi:hypothetical protein